MAHRYRSDLHYVLGAITRRWRTLKTIQGDEPYATLTDLYRLRHLGLIEIRSLEKAPVAHYRRTKIARDTPNRTANIADILARNKALLLTEGSIVTLAVKIAKGLDLA